MSKIKFVLGLMLALLALTLELPETQARGRLFRRHIAPCPERQRPKTGEVQISDPRMEGETVGGGGTFYVWGTKLDAVMNLKAYVVESPLMGSEGPQIDGELLPNTGTSHWVFRFKVANPSTQQYRLHVTGKLNSQDKFDEIKFFIGN